MFQIEHRQGVEPVFAINICCIALKRVVTLQFVIITQFVIHYKLRWIATQFVIHCISNCVVMATRFVMYYKLRQNFIILKYEKEKKFINGKMHRLNHILLWIQLDTNLFELGMQNNQSTLHLARTLFVPTLRHGPFDILGGGLGFFSKKNSFLWFWLKKNILLSGTVTLQFVIITQFVIHYKLRWITTQFVIHRISNCVVRATRFVMYYKLRQNFIILKYWKGEKIWSTAKCIASIIPFYEFN